MRDLHVHTEHSCDSDADMELYVKHAIDLNVETICFTDHVDLNKMIMDMTIIIQRISLKSIIK